MDKDFVLYHAHEKEIPTLRQAAEKLPSDTIEGVVDRLVTFAADYHVPTDGTITGIKCWPKDDHGHLVRIPEGSSSVKCDFLNGHVKFLYEGTKYIVYGKRQ